eukprot:scaffold40_cov305-Pinguiococcus_pyrenoidosus.AAC.20
MEEIERVLGGSCALERPGRDWGQRECSPRSGRPQQGQTRLRERTKESWGGRPTAVVVHRGFSSSSPTTSTQLSRARAQNQDLHDGHHVHSTEDLPCRRRVDPENRRDLRC